MLKVLVIISKVLLHKDACGYAKVIQKKRREKV
jgi:hypothetical protein